MKRYITTIRFPSTLEFKFKVSYRPKWVDMEGQVKSIPQFLRHGGTTSILWIMGEDMFMVGFGVWVGDK